MMRCAAARGVAAEQLYEAAGVAPLPGSPNERITLAHHFALWAAAMRAVADPSFPVEVGRAASFDIFDVMGYASRSAPDLRAAIDVILRYGRVHANDNVFAVEPAGDDLRVFMPPSGPLPLPARAATESVLVQTVALGRAIVGVELVPLEVTYRHAEPRDISAHTAFFGVRPRFEQPLTSVVISATDLERPCVGADPGLHTVLLRLADDALADTPSPTTTTGAAQVVIQKRLASGGATLENVAKELAMSARTLRRRLTEEGASFGALRDEVRHRLAQRYLEEDRLSLAEVAFLLGFSDERAFRRAFRRWEGRPPRGAS
jgi:AraC-like DNA-binding protein